MLHLERHLGRELFNRLPRGYELTADGDELMRIALDVESGIAPMLSVDSTSQRRRVKISAGTWTTYLLSQHIAELTADNAITLQFISADHKVDIPHREAVIGLRNHRPTQVGLAGRRIARIQFAVYAAHKDITTWVEVMNATPSAQWVHDHREGAPAIEVSHARSALDMAMLGQVKAVLPTFIGRMVPGLVAVSENIAELEHQQWLVTHHEDRHLPEVRQVIDRIERVIESVV